MLNIVVPKRTEKRARHLMFLDPLFKKGIENAGLRVGLTVKKRAIRMLSNGIRTGRKYPGLPNISSAPGEYPKTQSGRLASNLYYSRSLSKIRIGDKAKYAVYLEFGTKKMSARPNSQLPWLRKAITLENRNVENYLQKEVLRKIKC